MDRSVCFCHRSNQNDFRRKSRNSSHTRRRASQWGKSQREQELFLASAAQRQRVEVKIKDLTPEEIIQFEKAKDKELSQWLATDTVRRVLRHKIPEGQLLRSRWVLTCKPLDDIEASTGLSRKAKARLVILGFEDPAIDSLPRDSPTLERTPVC